MSLTDPFQKDFGASSEFTFRMAAVNLGDEESATNLNITDRAATTKMEWPATKITKPSATLKIDSSDKEENDESEDESEEEEEDTWEEVSSGDDITQEDPRYDLADDSEYDSEDDEEA
jgi:hypothetical protein